MPSLQLEELPDHIYFKLQENAKSSHRTLAQQAIETLAQGLNVPVPPVLRRTSVLASLEQDASKLQSYTLSSPEDLIRKDRDR